MLCHGERDVIRKLHLPEHLISINTMNHPSPPATKVSAVYGLSEKKSQAEAGWIRQRRDAPLQGAAASFAVRTESRARSQQFSFFSLLLVPVACGKKCRWWSLDVYIMPGDQIAAAVYIDCQMTLAAYQNCQGNGITNCR